MPTHTEHYRRLKALPHPRPLRFLTLALVSIRVATRKKLPLIILLGQPAAAMVIFSFLVYARFAMQAGSFGRATGFRGPEGMLMGMAAKTLAVKGLIGNFNLWSRLFAVLALSWYGAGLIAEDRRSQIHLLYFSRPLTRLQYLLGKLCVLLFFGFLSVILPGLVICATAVFSSPDYSFLYREPGTILATVGYGSLWVLVMALLVLAISSLAQRRSHALIGIFAVLVAPQMITRILRIMLANREVYCFSPWFSLRRIAEWWFELSFKVFHWPVSWSFAVIGVQSLVCLLVIWWRAGRLEQAA